MPWLKLDDTLAGHPKVDTLLDQDELRGLAAIGLWTLGLSLAGRHLTDGHLTRRAVLSIAPEVAEGLAADLIAARLWEPAERGWQIHDYLPVQDSREVVLARRDKDARRKARERKEAEGARAAKAGRRESAAAARGVRGDVPEDVQSDNDSPSRRTSTGTSKRTRRDVRLDVREESERPSEDPTRPDPTRPVSPDGETDNETARDAAVAAATTPQEPDDIERACDVMAQAGLLVMDRRTVTTLAAQHPDVDIVQAAIRCANWMAGGRRRVRAPLAALKPFVEADDAPRKGAAAAAGNGPGGRRVSPEAYMDGLREQYIAAQAAEDEGGAR